MKLRTRLLGTVAFTALAFAVIVGTNVSVSRDVEERLIHIQRNDIPRLELAPKLEADFALLKRSYQDAVAAHDMELLGRTNEVRDQLVADLERGAPFFDPARLAEVRVAIRESHESALDVSRRMMAGSGDEETVSAIAAMQKKQARTEQLITRLAAVDPAELKAGFDAAYEAEQRGARNERAVMLACLALVLALSLWNLRYVVGALTKLELGFARFGSGRLDEGIAADGDDELAAVAEEANKMAKNLSEAGAEREARDWLRAGLVELANELRGELSEEDVANRAARALAVRTRAVAAALYVRDTSEANVFRLRGQHALEAGAEPGKAALGFTVGEGLLGEAARGTALMIIDDVPADFLHVRSALAEAVPARLVFVPLVFDGKVAGVLELATFKPLTAEGKELLTAAGESVAIALAVAQSRSATNRLLVQTQKQAARLLEQEEELRSTNEELRCQQEELRHTNDELATQRGALEERNTELQKVGHSLEQKAAELATVSAYKSQFLANMSHELRTPLNSMLLLSKLLEENAEGNLTAKQVEYAKTVHGAGKDLLLLINQVLDLAKVEAGKQTLQVDTFEISELADRMRRTFEVLAKEKHLDFEIVIDADAPRQLTTDRQRLGQILTNLLGNAIKFTEKGSVTLHIGLVSTEMVAFSVHDTGIGIAPEYQSRVFQPFEQVDGSARRKHGGTGLGLGIARELAVLLGGDLRLDSTPGRGSVFTCLVPTKPPAEAPKTTAPNAPVAIEHRPASDLDLLVIEDDSAFAAVLGDLIRARGLVHAAANDGATGLRIARERRPRGILLDVKLPDMDGWAVMEKLQADPATAGIPVHFVSGLEMADRGMAMGAVGYLQKPAAAPELARVIERLGRRADAGEKRVLVVEGDPAVVQQLVTFGVAARRVASIDEALVAMDEQSIACLVVDLDAAGDRSLAWLDRLEARAKAQGKEALAVVVCTSRPLGREEAMRLERYADAVVMKEGASTDRLIDEIRLFVRRLEGRSPARAAAGAERAPDVQLGGKKLLVVDDDMRTIYALSAMLRSRGADVVIAENGGLALNALDENPDVDAILMDVMMPEMDGYEATRRVRAQSRFATVPIIALTAKAMKGDEQRCLEAGATEYLAKPIDAVALFAALQRLVVDTARA